MSNTMAVRGWLGAARSARTLFIASFQLRAAGNLLWLGKGCCPAVLWEPSLQEGDTQPPSPINSTRSLIPRPVEAE